MQLEISQAAMQCHLKNEQVEEILPPRYLCDLGHTPGVHPVGLGRHRDSQRPHSVQRFLQGRRGKHIMLCVVACLLLDPEKEGQTNKPLVWSAIPAAGAARCRRRLCRRADRPSGCVPSPGRPSSPGISQGVGRLL